MAILLTGTGTLLLKTKAVSGSFSTFGIAKQVS
jgi:hypothetical protein